MTSMGTRVWTRTGERLARGQRTKSKDEEGNGDEDDDRQEQQDEEDDDEDEDLLVVQPRYVGRPPRSQIGREDVALYFVHWLTDLAGAEPTPLAGCEKFSVKFPLPVLNSTSASSDKAANGCVLGETSDVRRPLAARRVLPIGMPARLVFRGSSRSGCRLLSENAKSSFCSGRASRCAACKLLVRWESAGCEPGLPLHIEAYTPTVNAGTAASCASRLELWGGCGGARQAGRRTKLAAERLSASAGP